MHMRREIQLRSSYVRNQRHRRPGFGTYVILSVVALALLGMLGGERREGQRIEAAPPTVTSNNVATKGPSEEYPGPWLDEVNPAILRTLVRNGVPSCPDMKTRPAATSSGLFDPHGEFLVYCLAPGG